MISRGRDIIVNDPVDASQFCTAWIVDAVDGRAKNQGADTPRSPVDVIAKHPASTSFIVALSLILTITTSGLSDDTQPPLKSGPPIGSEVSSFYVRAVTGPLAGKSVCYVCRNGDRPVVMVFLRELGADTTRLLKQLDKTVNEHRANGLRCFVVLLSESAQKDAARLQTLAFDEKLDLPLTLAGESMAGANLSNIASDAAVTIVMYDHLKVTERFSYRTGECNESGCKMVIAATEKLATTGERGVSAP